uniref:Uncharacterized protein n=1 Tax=Plectus sambesii TaxID=2011161 RepID=A0A914UZ00_9BILA
MAASMEPVVQLVKKYHNEFESTIESLRQRSFSLGVDTQRRACEAQTHLRHMQASLQPRLRSQQQQLAATLKDYSPVPANYSVLLETYMWTSVLLVAQSFGELVGAYALGPLLGLVFDTAPATVLTYVLLPVLAYMHYRKKPGTQTERRFELLGLALTLGVLSGFLLSDRYLGVLPPPAFLMPLVIGISAQVVGPKVGEDRLLFLCSTVGAGATVHVLLGIVLRQLGGTYLLFVLVSVVLAAIHMQLLLKHMTVNNRPDMIAFQLLALVTSLLVHGVLTLFLGFSHGAE